MVTAFLCERCQFGLEIFFLCQADDLFFHLTGLEEENRWNCTDAVFRGELLVVVYIHFRNRGAVTDFAGELLEDRSNRFAGAAPGGPKVDEDGLVTSDGGFKGC